MTKPAGAERTPDRAANRTAEAREIREIRCTVLHPGRGSGEILVLDEPVSFWGGVSAAGEIIDRHHPQCGTSVTGRVLVMSGGRGSSSSSSVLAEQIRAHTAPAAIVISETDTIVVLGAVVAAELYGSYLPVMQIDAGDLAALFTGGWAGVDAVPRDDSIGGTTTLRVATW